MRRYEMQMDEGCKDIGWDIFSAITLAAVSVLVGAVEHESC